MTLILQQLQGKSNTTWLFIVTPPILTATLNIIFAETVNTMENLFHEIEFQLHARHIPTAQVK